MARIMVRTAYRRFVCLFYLVALLALGAAVCPAVRAQSFTNPDFETGDFTGYNTVVSPGTGGTGTASVTTFDTVAGVPSFAATYSFSGTGSVGDTRLALTQSLTFPSAGTLTIEADTAATFSGPSMYNIVEINPTLGGLSVTPRVQYFNFTGTAGRTLSVTTAVSAGTHQVGFLFRLTNAVSEYQSSTPYTLTAFLDNVRLTFTPESVTPAETGTGVSASVNPSVTGQSATFTATVSATAPGAGTPTGQVQFFLGDATTPFDTQTLSGGQATSTAQTFAAAGAYQVKAVYRGDTNFNPSQGTLSQSVNRAATTTGLSSSQNPSTAGQSATFTATVGVTSPGAGTPTGTVTFTIDGTAGAPVSVSGGQASTTLALTAAGPHTVTATYNGDSDFQGSTSSALTQTVGYSWSGFLSPLPRQSVSRGSTLPVKFALTGASAGITTLSGKLYVTGPGGGAETLLGTFKYSLRSGQYVYSWNTSKSQQAGTYTLRADLGDGVSVGRTIQVTLR